MLNLFMSLEAWSNATLSSVCRLGSLSCASLRLLSSLSFASIPVPASAPPVILLVTVLLILLVSHSPPLFVVSYTLLLPSTAPSPPSGFSFVAKLVCISDLLLLSDSS